MIERRPCDGCRHCIANAWTWGILWKLRWQELIGFVRDTERSGAGAGWAS